MKKILSLSLVLMFLLSMALPAMAEEKVTMTWIHHFLEEPLQKWVEGRVAAFEEKHPNVKVNIEVVNTDVYLNTLKMKIAADDAPMIFDVDNNSYLQEFVAAGHVYNVDGEDYYSLVDPSLQKECQIDGVNYGSTISTCSYNVWYNKTLFEEHGLEVPTTREEYIALCDKLLELGITPISAAFAERWCLLFEYYPYYMNYCWKDDANFCIDKVNGTKKFSDDQRVKDSYTEFLSTSKYWGDDPFGTSYDDACMAVANGSAAMISQGSWVLSKLRGYNPDVEYGVFGIPTEQQGNPIIMRPGSVQCVYNTSDEKMLQYALELSAELFTVEGGTAFAEGAMQISSVQGVDYSFDPCLKSVMDYENKWSYAGFQRWNNEYEDLWADTMMEATLEGKDADTMCAELDEKFSTMQ